MKVKKTSRTNASSTLSSIIRNATIINATDPNTGKLLNGHKIKLSKSAIIPLSFDCVLDGISGIVIGNIFKINKEYLPKAYQADNIAFIVTSEKQKVTVGQDWTTTIGGQLIIKDDTYEATEAVEIIEEIESNSNEEINLNKIDDDEEKKGDLINPTQDSKNFIDQHSIQFQGHGYPQRPNGDTHNGIDLPMTVGTPFRAMADGTVKEGFQKGYKQLKAADGTLLWNLKKGIKPSGGSTKTTKNVYGEKRYCAHHVDTGPSDTYHNNLDDFEKVTKKGRSYGMMNVIWEKGNPAPAVDTASQTENPRGWGAGLYLTLTLDKEVSVAGGHTLKFVRMFHCSEIVKTGPVKQGDIIAKSGGKAGQAGSGNSTGPHLHFETADGSGKKKGRFNPKFAIRYPYLVKYKTFSSFGENDNLKTDEERAASGQQ